MIGRGGRVEGREGGREEGWKEQDYYDACRMGGGGGGGGEQQVVVAALVSVVAQCPKFTSS